LPLLAVLLGDAETDIREDAITNVSRIFVHPRADHSINSAAAAFEAARFHDQPWPVPPELATALVKALADNEPSVRRDAAYAVGIVLTPPVTDAIAFEILASLGDYEPSVRVAAARALGRLEVQNAGVPLISRVNDEDLDVRLASISALGALRYKPAVVSLTDQFKYYVRGSAGRRSARLRKSVTRPRFRCSKRRPRPGIRCIGGRRTKAWRARVVRPLPHRESKPPWSQKRTRG
jgi:hypothetical protein